VRVAHDQEYLTDPLDRDTDKDSMTDGREVIAGVNPNRDDAGSVVDSDNDGLSDNEENMGWTIMVNQNGMNDTFTKIVRSDPYRADTDRDAIPDVYERAIGTDPRVRDTDNDSLLDWYEFDETDIIRYDVNALVDARQRCDDASDCIYTPPESYEITSTDPCETDSDGDGLTDLEEIIIESDPNDPDTDGDGLDDKQEQDWGTDPNEVDTDADGINDYIEVSRGTDPLVKDKLVRFKLISIYCQEADDEGSFFDSIEVDGDWYVSVDDINYLHYNLDDKELDTGDTVDINKSADIILMEDEVIAFTATNVIERDSTSDDDPFSDINKNFSYSTLTSGTWSESISGSDGKLDTDYSITVITGMP
jgi:hypothetical protein